MVSLVEALCSGEKQKIISLCLELRNIIGNANQIMQETFNHTKTKT